MSGMIRVVDGTVVLLTEEQVAARLAEEQDVGTTPAVVTAISDRQFFQALATPPFSLITPAEALAAVKMGELPAALAAILDGIESEADRFAAEMLLSGATVFERDHPMVVEIAEAMDPPWSPAEIDAFWTFAAGL